MKEFDKHFGMASTRTTARDWDRNATNVNDTSVNNLAQPGRLADWLDISHGGSRTVHSGRFESAGSLISLAEDCAYVLAADFPEVQGPFRPECLAGTAGRGFGGINSSDVLNLLGGLANIAPQGMPVAMATHPWMLLTEDGMRTIGEGNGADNAAVTLQPKRPPPAPRGGGGRRGRKRQAQTRALGSMTLLFRGTIGDSGSLQALSLPWTLSLQKLNRALAPSDETSPEVST